MEFGSFCALYIRNKAFGMWCHVEMYRHFRRTCRFQRPRGLRSRSAATRLLRLWIRIPPGAWMFVCCECCVFPDRGLCDELITRPEESYWMWCVAVCDLETSLMKSPWPALGHSATWKKNAVVFYMAESAASYYHIYDGGSQKQTNTNTYY